MLDKNDLRAIAEMIHAEISASEQRMKAFVIEEVHAEISASERRMKAFVTSEANCATSQAIAYTESSVETQLDLIKEGLDLGLELPRIPEERVERIEQDVEALKLVVRNQAEMIEKLQRSA